MGPKISNNFPTSASLVTEQDVYALLSVTLVLNVQVEQRLYFYFRLIIAGQSHILYSQSRPLSRQRGRHNIFDLFVYFFISGVEFAGVNQNKTDIISTRWSKIQRKKTTNRFALHIVLLNSFSSTIIFCRKQCIGEEIPTRADKDLDGRDEIHEILTASAWRVGGNTGWQHSSAAYSMHRRLCTAAVTHVDTRTSRRVRMRN